MNITEKVAYLKGLAEGLQLDSKSKEGKLLLAMVDVLDDIAYTVADLEDEVAQLNELTEELDEDLSELESFCYDEEDEDEDDDLDAFDEDDFYEITCPSCEETIYVDEESLQEELDCPSCGKKIELEIDCQDSCCAGPDKD